MSCTKYLPLILLATIMSCNATDSVNHYESDDTASGPRISKEHLLAPPDTTSHPKKKRRDSTSLRIPPPGVTDTTSLNIQ